MHESSFCLHPPRLDEICVYLEVTWSQRFAKAEESKRSLKRRKTWESQVPFQIFCSEQSLFYQTCREHICLQNDWKERPYLSYSPTGLILIRGAPFYERGPCLHIETLEVQQKKQRHDNYLPSHNHFVVLVLQIQQPWAWQALQKILPYGWNTFVDKTEKSFQGRTYYNYFWTAFFFSTLLLSLHVALHRKTYQLEAVLWHGGRFFFSV